MWIMWYVKKCAAGAIFLNSQRRDVNKYTGTNYKQSTAAKLLVKVHLRLFFSPVSFTQDYFPLPPPPCFFSCLVVNIEWMPRGLNFFTEITKKSVQGVGYIHILVRLKHNASLCSQNVGRLTRPLPQWTLCRWISITVNTCYVMRRITEIMDYKSTASVLGGASTRTRIYFRWHYKT